MSQPKVSAQVKGVSETLLWPLYNRATEARRPDAMLIDPAALSIADSIDYPFEKHFGQPDEYHVLRALCFDDQIRKYLKRFPDATVVALGDGLETACKRVDNGKIKWLAVDLEATIELRRQFLPDSDRHHNLVCSALDLRWMDGVDSTRGVFITAQGLLMYFEEKQVKELIAACAERFPNGCMIFDLIPRWLSEKTLRGYQKTRSYSTPPMPFGMDAHESTRISTYHPNIVSVQEIEPPRGRSFHFRYKLPIMRSIPVLRNRRSSFVLVNFGPGNGPR
jgi:O-methyltransferase involved in polyketide biosynthesis